METTKEIEKINIYQMYLANGNKAGFFVRRNSWSNKIAKIVTVGGKTCGELAGRAPYFDNPKVFGKFDDNGSIFEVTCAGTFAYTLIEKEMNDE